MWQAADVRVYCRSDVCVRACVCGLTLHVSIQCGDVCLPLLDACMLQRSHTERGIPFSNACTGSMTCGDENCKCQ